MTPLEFILIYLLINGMCMLTICYMEPDIIPKGHRLGATSAFIVSLLTVTGFIPFLIVYAIYDILR